MVDNDYTNMEGVAVDKEAIEFDSRNDDNQVMTTATTTMTMTMTTMAASFTARSRQQRSGRKGRGRSQ
jgi:hypothetical protein